jgi:hypothetical protein
MEIGKDMEPTVENFTAEIQRQLSLKSAIECVGPPHVVLNGKELLALFDKFITAQVSLHIVVDEVIKRWDALGKYKDDDFGTVAEAIEVLRKTLSISTILTQG